VLGERRLTAIWPAERESPWTWTWTWVWDVVCGMWHGTPSGEWGESHVAAKRDGTTPTLSLHLAQPLVYTNGKPRTRLAIAGVQWSGVGVAWCAL